MDAVGFVKFESLYNMYTDGKDGRRASSEKASFLKI